MGTKQNPAKYDCYANALPDEPMFVLLARDPTAPAIVKEWAEMREQAIETGNRPRSDYTMVTEARDCALAMEAWRKQNNGKWRAPDPQHPQTSGETI